MRTKDVKAKLAQLDMQVREPGWTTAFAGIWDLQGCCSRHRRVPASHTGDWTWPKALSLDPYQEKTARKEKQQLLDVQRQVALEREVCLPLVLLPLLPPHSLPLLSSLYPISVQGRAVLNYID